ncbi:hypothetical protein P154DRAFT_517500 [Amniculicola lignicola CBS 123094]|uniref:Uncharacterized protein n=1 Tax=Amniculicola lignicola CBS 123094 TaxID=1392246 RepID=A0A6A5X2Z7_9PLEO|nr:hypothetical protein P154DRAFT_517500 [Amniculicola lignicola CBS 123094]
MCKFIYTFHPCGHMSYTFSTPTFPTCSPQNICLIPDVQYVCENMALFVHEACVGRKMCAECLTSTPPSPSLYPSPDDPYLKSLPSIVLVLQQSLHKLSFASGQAVDYARRYVAFLARMSANYKECGAANTSTEQMAGYIGSAYLSATPRQTPLAAPRPPIYHAPFYHPLARPAPPGILPLALRPLLPRPQTFTKPFLPFHSVPDIPRPPSTSSSSILTNPSQDSATNLSRFSSPISFITNPSEDVGCGVRHVEWECGFCGSECFCWGLAD